MKSIINLKSFIIFSIFISLSFSIISCVEKISWETHPSGLKYRYIVKSEDGTKTELGQILTLKMQYRSENDSLLFDSRELRKMYRMQLADPSHEGGSIEDALALMSVGDSMIFKVNAYNFYTKTRSIGVPKGIRPESDITFYVKLSGLQSIKQIEKEKAALFHTNRDEEEKLLERYLKIANITTEPTISGLYYIERVKGTGRKIEAGHKISVHYTGKFIDGQIFDSSVERHKPFEFVFGTGLIIQGWEEGLSKMYEGGKATLIIPSALAYAEKGKGPVPPFSTLIFEVELLKVY